MESFDNPDAVPEPLDRKALERLREMVRTLESHTGPFGTWLGGESTGPNTITMPYVIEIDAVREVMSFLYDTRRIVWFDWVEWNEGREIFRDWTPKTATSLDHLTLRKLLTSVARNDRFCEGAWVGMFENGQGVELFVRLLECEEALRCESVEASTDLLY